MSESAHECSTQGKSVDLAEQENVSAVCALAMLDAYSPGAIWAVGPCFIRMHACHKKIEHLCVGVA